jgi:ATP-dependent RNA helicase RhlE
LIPNRFEDLSLHPALLAAVRDAGYAAPTAIQARAIPLALAGRDLVGCAQTGTGKTAAYVLPIVQRLGRATGPGGRPRAIRALVLAPTRELAAQIGAEVARFGAPAGLASAVVHGGVAEGPQRRALRAGVDVLVATPGRLEDLMRAGVADLRGVLIAVLDEADRMLDQGFLPAVRRVLAATPRERQTLLFSATLPDEIRALARSVQRSPEEIAVAPVATPAARVDQHVLFVAKPDKRQLLTHLLADPAVTRALVFTRTRRSADRVAKHLRESEQVEAIHGDRSQAQRDRALARFKSGTARVLVATDVAARGIDVEGISHVINYELPDDSESYVHRIGRTGRAAASGVALSLCDAGERGQLARIERLMRKQIPVRGGHPFVDRHEGPALAARAPGARQGQPSTGRPRRRGGRGASFSHSRG